MKEEAAAETEHQQQQHLSHGWLCLHTFLFGSGWCLTGTGRPSEKEKRTERRRQRQTIKKKKKENKDLFVCWLVA